MNTRVWNSPRPMIRAASSSPLRRLGLTLICAILGACTTPSGGNNTGTMSVTTAGDDSGLATDTVADRARAIEAYRSHLLLYPDTPQYDAISRRLADLLVEQAADLKLVTVAGEKRSEVDERAREYYSEAAAHYEYLLRQDPDKRDNIQLLYQQARAYQGRGDTVRALETIEQLLASKPDGDIRLYADVRFRQGELYFAEGDFPEAERSYRAVTALGTTAPTYAQALYKLGWSLFRQERYRDVLPPLLRFLQEKAHPVVGNDSELTGSSQAEQEQTEEVYGLINSSIAQLGGVDAITLYIRHSEWSDYADRICLKLAEWYVARGQVVAAAETWVYLARFYPDSVESPRLLLRSITLYREHGFSQLATDTEKELVRSYGMDSRFWESHSATALPDVVQAVASVVAALAENADQSARDTGDPDAARLAEQWYREYLAWFGSEPAAAEVNFQFAQLLYARGRYREAFDEFEHIAWAPGDNSYAADAALGAQLAWQKLALEPESPPPGLRERALAGALRFVENWPDHASAPALLASSGVTLLAQQQYQTALSVSEQTLAQSSSTSVKLHQVAWSLRAQALFAMGDHAGAASAYRAALALTDSDDPRSEALREGLAQADYRLAGQAVANGDTGRARVLYARAAELAPGTPVGSKSTYDVATLLLAQEAWAEAIQACLRFREDYPEDPSQSEVTRKLAFAYERNGEPGQAAEEYMQLVREHLDTGEMAREALLHAADLYLQAGHPDKAAAARERYLNRFPAPAAIAIQQMVQLARYEQEKGDDQRQKQWLEAIVSRDRTAGDLNTKAVAAHAALELARYRLTQFRQVLLVEPVRKNLALKLDAMDRTLRAFSSAADYGVSPVTAAANFYIAHIYEELGDALMTSERPPALTAEEMAEYNHMLTEQARPFRQQAIEMYTANTLNTGDEKAEHWNRKSAERLRELKDGT